MGGVPVVLPHGFPDDVHAHDAMMPAQAPPRFPAPHAAHFTAGYRRRVLDRVGHFLPRRAPDALVQAIGAPAR